MHIDELENVATHNAYPAPAVTPGRGILKTPGRVKTPAASTARTPKAWNNNPNAKHRVTSPENLGVSNAGMKTPAAAKMAQFARTPGRTPGIDASHSSRPKSVFATTPATSMTTTPARLAAASRTPGAGTRTPGGSMFSQAPARIAVDAGAKTPKRYRALMVSRAPRTPGGASGALEDDGPAAVLKTLPNATQAAYWLRRAMREEQRGNFDDALSFLEQGIKRHARPSEDLAAAKKKLEEKMKTNTPKSPPPATAAPAAVTSTADAHASNPAIAPVQSPATESATPPTPIVGPSPAEKHCDAAIDKLDAILRSPKPLTLASIRASAKRAASSGVARTPTTTAPDANAMPSASVPSARGATPFTARVLQHQLTPNSEFAALESAVAAEAAEERRVAEEDALAAKEAAAAMLMRQDSVRASLTPVRSASPRSHRPPKSPSLGAKATALSRTASVASASVLGTPPTRVAVAKASPSSEVTSEMLSPATMLPSLPTPTAEPQTSGPGPSPGKAAREACEAEGVSPTAAVADAVARATPSSVETRRGRSDRRSPIAATVSAPAAIEPRSAPLPETPHGEPRSFATPAALSAVTPIAPNAARRIATPGKGGGASPLSAFARMMAKVIVDTADDAARTPARSAAETVSAALADTPEK